MTDETTSHTSNDLTSNASASNVRRGIRSDPEAYKAYQRDLMRRKRAEARGKPLQPPQDDPGQANAAPAPQTTPNIDSASNVIKLAPHKDDRNDRKRAKAEKRAQLQELKAEADQAAREPAKRKVGAPTIYTSELGDEICLRLALREPLVKICADAHMPCETTVYVWRQRVPDFAAGFARAREHRAEARADRIDELVDMLTVGKLAPDAARVAIQAEQWQAGKEQPRVYGDKVDVTSAGQPLQQVDAAAAVRALLDALPDLVGSRVIDVEALPAPADVEATPVELDGEA